MKEIKIWILNLFRILDWEFRIFYVFVSICLCAFVSSLSHAATVTLEWDPVTTNADNTPITDLAGYRLFQSSNSLLGLTTQQAMADSTITKISISSITTSHTISDLVNNNTFYFRLSAFDMSGNESAFNVDNNDLDVEVSTYIVLSPAPAPPVPEPEPKPPIVRILPKVSFDLDMDSDKKYFHGNLALIRVKVEEGSSRTLKVKIRYSDVSPFLTLTYSLNMVKVSSGLYAGYVDTRKLNTDSGVLSYKIEIEDEQGDTVATTEKSVSIDSKVEVAPDSNGRFEANDGNPIDGELKAEIPKSENVRRVEFRRLKAEQYAARDEKEVDLKYGYKPVSVYGVSVVGQTSSVFNDPVTLTLVYNDIDGTDVNGDGMPDGDEYVDGTTIPEQDLRIFWYDGINWRLIGGAVDTVKNTVTAQVKHFSVYGLFPVISAPSAAKAQEKFLSPTLQDGINDLATFGLEAEEVTIYDVTGRKIFHAVQEQSSTITWNCRDESGNIVESGIYIAKIKQKDDKTVHQNFAIVK